MKQINALVTGIGGPIAQGVLRGLKEMENVRIIGADRRKFTSGNQFCNDTYQIPRYTDVDVYKNAILDIVKKENIDIIFPSLHEEIEIYHASRDFWNAEIALPQSDRFEMLLNKEDTYKYLTELNLEQYIPKYYGFNSSSELMQIKRDYFPNDKRVVVKAASEYASIGFAILTDRENYLQNLRKGNKDLLALEDYSQITDPANRKIVMEYLDGTEYSVDVFLHDGKVITAVPRERTGVSNRIVLDGIVVENEELIKAATEISEKIATSGFINLQFYSTKDGYKLTDINPRFCGSQVMSLGANVNFPRLFIQYNLLKEPVSVTPNWNTRMIRFRENLFIHNA